MEYAAHGGLCCGIAHIYNMDFSRIVDLDEFLNAHYVGANNNRVIEIVLSERQVTPTHPNRNWAACVERAGGWPAVLAERGFILKSRFTNSNTGRNCYIFHKNSVWLPLDNLPFQYPANLIGNVVPAGPAIPVVQARRVVDVEYYAELRTVGRRGPFNTEEEARNAYPRCRNFSRRNILMNGESEWNPIQAL